ncbi:MAG: hypothetical protein IJJ22_05805 [Oscillospiraceae bacterium]|nr:hypothetical protein [Oscillospiraceae bacterium]
MDQTSLFRKESVENIQSPEQLNDYMRVTNPAVWIVLISVIILLAGMLIWSYFATIDSFARGSAFVEDGSMVVVFTDAQVASNVKEGMTVSAGESTSVINSLGRLEDGTLFALAQTDLPNGSYDASVLFKQTQVLKLLFN